MSTIAKHSQNSFSCCSAYVPKPFPHIPTQLQKFRTFYHHQNTDISSARQEDGAPAKSTKTFPDHVPTLRPRSCRAFAAPRGSRIELGRAELKQGGRWTGIELQRGFGHVDPALVVAWWDLQRDPLGHIRCNGARGTDQAGERAGGKRCALPYAWL